MAKRGKYAGVISKLPRDFGQEPGYQQKVNAVKAALLADMRKMDPPQAPTASTMAQKYRDVRVRKDEIEAELSDINVEEEAIKQILVDAYDGEDVTNLHLATGGAVRVQWEPQAKVVDRDKFRDWCFEDEDFKKLMTLPWQTANSMVKELLLLNENEEGPGEMPPGVEATARPKVVYSKE